jgi:hypothetical protein
MPPPDRSPPKWRAGAKPWRRSAGMCDIAWQLQPRQASPAAHETLLLAPASSGRMVGELRVSLRMTLAGSVSSLQL